MKVEEAVAQLLFENGFPLTKETQYKTQIAVLKLGGYENLINEIEYIILDTSLSNQADTIKHVSNKYGARSCTIIMTLYHNLSKLKDYCYGNI